MQFIHYSPCIPITQLLPLWGEGAMRLERRWIIPLGRCSITLLAARSHARRVKHSQNAFWQVQIPQWISVQSGRLYSEMTAVSI